MKKLAYLLILLMVQLPLIAFGQQSFVVRKIEVQGLKYLNPETVRNYLPIKVGQTLRPAKASAILKTLYKTGFFDQISLSQSGNTLIIHVSERSTIGSLKVTGNSIIQTDKLTTVMKSMDVAEGRIYNPSTLEKIKQSLLYQYYQMGHYNARVDIVTTPMSRNRVAVAINISEGMTAKIKRISIIGNHVFSDKTLINQLDVTTSGLITFFTQTDRYSEEKLEASLEKLRGFYLDHGYLRFMVKSSQAEVTPDRKAVYINIVIDEGQPYRVKGVDLTGQLAVSREELLSLVQIKPGQVFSRQKVIDSERAITRALGDKGYAFATININPEIDDQNRTVNLNFVVNSGKRVYVRHLTFSNNNRTNDEVLRRELEQMEGAPISTSKLEESTHRLKMLPYLKEVDMGVNPVPDVPDQVDVDYKVKEDNSAQATFKLGYSQTYGVILGAGLNQKNFFGTGNSLGINLQHSSFEQYYGIDYTDPYYTADGISRTFTFAASRINPSGAPGLTNDYTTNEYDFGVIYGIPIGQETGIYNRIIAGAIYQNTLMKLTGTISNQVSTFVTNHGRHFQELDLRVGYSRDSRDKAIFPTQGTIQSLVFDTYLPLDSNSLMFYILNYHGKWYHPLTDKFIFISRADFGYGNAWGGISNFPIFRNFFAGGIDSVRGYEGFTLGPRDSTGGNNGKGRSIGGNMLIDGSIGIIFPNFISENLRTIAFIDAGNVYSSQDNRKFGGSSTNSGPLRYSIGIEADILTPFGPIGLSIAKAINPRRGDDTQIPQFALGANF